MDWIERVLRISPDGGDGSAEFSVIIGSVIALAMIAAGALKFKLRPISQPGCRRMALRLGRAPRRLLDRFDG